MNQHRKPKIIYAWDYVQWGGAQIYFLALIKEVNKFFDVTVVLPRSSDSQLLKFIDDLSVSIEFVDTEADDKPATTVMRKIQRRRNKRRSEKILLNKVLDRDLSNTIVHIETSPWQSHSSLLKLARKTKVFVTAHNSLGKAPNWRCRLWKYKLHAVARNENFWFFSSNDDSKRYFAQYFPSSFVRERVRVTYTSVNPIEIDNALSKPIDKNALKERFGIPKEKLVVMCVGQFIDRKGRWTFLDAAARLKNLDDVTFVWIANSAPSAESYARVDSYGLGERFRLLTGEQIGPERADLLEMFRVADVFVLASFVEGLPISLLEAMALGIPSISTNVNAIPEAVLHLNTGILIEAGDGEALASSVKMMKDDLALRTKLAASGRDWVLAHFDEREVARIAIDAYNLSLGLPARR